MKLPWIHMPSWEGLMTDNFCRLCGKDLVRVEAK